jgi:hypothetical protein
MKNKQNLCATALLLLTLAALSPRTAHSAASANLNQGRNGTDTIPVNPINWVNGNLGVANAHYNEEMSVPFQCIMTGLTPGVQVVLVIGYDVRNSSKNAFDYLTHYDRLLPHNFNLHNTAEAINPLTGTGLSAATPYTTYPIPAPSSAGSTVPGQPTASFNSLPAGERLMTLFNGTIDSMYYVVQGNLTAAQSETQLAIKFTPSGAIAVLAWGGHIGSRNYWGYTSGIPNSAGGISGSPFHMRLNSWSLNNLGNTDRSVSGYTVGPPSSPSLPVELVHFAVSEMPHTNSVEWSTASEVNNNYFKVERSVDGINFETLGTIKGAGNSSLKNNYALIDFTPLNGVSYYRLVQTDFDGMQKTYGPLSVRRNNIATALSVASAYPNPFAEEVSITYTSAYRKVTQVNISNASGNNVAHQTVMADEGTNSFRYSGNELPDGIYFITLSQPGEKSVTTVIIKQ